MTTLSGKTIIMSGGSRGIGLAIAVRAARDGANIALIAKTSAPDPRLAGTIHTAAAAIEAAGGHALPIVGDVRDDETIASAVDKAAAQFGGIDIVVNNASVLNLSPTASLDPKRYDLMQDVNVRGTFMLTRAALPHLLASPDPKVLTLSPPINLDPRWFAGHPAYTMAKYGMTMAALGFAHELGQKGISSTCLWPATLVATDAIGNLPGGDQMVKVSRRPDIVADAAYEVLTTDGQTLNGQTIIDEDLLRARGVADFAPYSMTGKDEGLAPDLFLS
ncbi:NAD(P)-dependent oxidoreductase [Nostocoides sp. HKS02]|uniref:SDR family oxidoreductase n=1 Tax=Nostocoides sp. HKS02 TaxID=1813880 RepID=UPI0012B48CBD|nr:NAD(P)-dependent oxidoreductase [Tetrasphaera sp. HKS02]QGN58498.1 SDR family NAD(P)-dependent oxidoreductase [Tetrasphaera sp. HKS02]